MIKKHLLLLFFVLSATLNAQHAPIKEWDYKQNDGIGEFIKADSQGNIIVVGKTDYLSIGYSRIKLLKQDKNGNVIWQQTYVDSITTYIDEAFDVVIDTFDNIYVAGRTNFDSSVPPPDFSQSLILKYDPQGNLLWVRKWGNNLQMGGGAKRMKLFKNKYINVVGYMDSWTSGYTNGFTLQYDSSGVMNWADTINANYTNSFVDIEEDKIGNIYSVGVTACCLPGYDTRVMKYDLGGNLIWSKILTDTIHPYIYPKDAVIDDSSNIYVGGDTKKIIGPNDYDIFMSKIDSSGNQKWWTTYATTTDSNWDVVVGVISDYNNDYYLYGYVLPFGSGGNNLAMVTKMSKNGNVEWTWKYDTLNNIGNEAFFYNGFLMHDSSLVFTGAENTVNLNKGGILVVSLMTDGQKKWLIEDTCECYFNSIIEIDSSLYGTGCDYVPASNMDSLFICKLVSDSITNVRTTKLEASIRIYPNPFSSELHFRVSGGSKPIRITFLNIWGEVLEISQFNNRRIDTTQLPSGLYILKIEYSDNTFQQIKISKI